MDRTTDRLSHREGDNRRISTRGTLNFVRGIGSSSNFVNLWEFSKKFPGKKNILTSIRFRQYGLVIWSIPVGDLAHTGWWFGQYRLAIWPIPVGVLANTSWQFGQYRRRYIFQDLGRFVIEIRDSKNMGGLRIIPRYGIKSKKRSIWLQKCPFKYNVVDEPHSINVDTMHCSRNRLARIIFVLFYRGIVPFLKKKNYYDH